MTIIAEATTSTFIPCIGRSPLLRAANHMLQILERLPELYPHYSPQERQQTLLEHLKTFQSRAVQLGTDPIIAEASTALLCEWSERILNDASLPIPFAQSLNLPMEQDHVIKQALKKAEKEPRIYLNFLELYYLGHRLDYIKDTGMIDVNNLHACIKHTRAQIEKIQTPRLKVHKQHTSQLWSVLSFIAFAGLLLYGALYVSMQQSLQNLLLYLPLR